ncbi:MAG: hypothetical protein HUU55_20845 [Myxococcales bacterium]|nr:hypothetical protein [Myxococcales bacterium]
MNIVVLAGCAGWTLVGCEQFRPEPVDPVIPRLKVNLPESPPLELPNVPVRDESGVYTVNGLLKESAALMNTVVIVKGVILDRHVCEQEPTALPVAVGEGSDAGSVPAPPVEPPECYPPEHVMLVDDLSRTRYQLLVAGNPQFVDSAAVGQTVTVKGRLVQWTRDNVFVRSEGLIELEPPPPPIEPTPAAAAESDAN